MDVSDAQTTWHNQPIERVAAELETRLDCGLSTTDAAARLERIGPNELREKPRAPFWKLIAAQLSSFVVILLIVASFVSVLLGDVIESIVIMLIVVLNGVLSVLQESRAEAALAALRKMAAPEAEVIRDGHRQKVPGRQLVPGDVVLLEAGNFVPADLRLIESINLRIDEASLTGESVAVEKRASDVVSAEAALGDRKNAAYMSTMVTYGRGKGLVVSTGMSTQMGLIAELIQSFEDEPTPLQKKLEQLGRMMGFSALAICSLVFATFAARALMQPGADLAGALAEAFLTSVSLAIAAVPEGLPAIVTISLALGMREMIKRHALIRRLSAVETLGSATTICSDKTGTLTQNEMTAVQLWVHHAPLLIEGRGYQPDGVFRRYDEGNRVVAVRDDVEVSGLLWAAALANDAHLERTGETAQRATYRMVGDPTEGALVVAAAKANLWRPELEQHYPRVAEVPFDSDRKCMSTLHELRDVAEDDGSPFMPNEQGYALCVKGAPDVLLEQSTQLLHRKGPLPLEAHDRDAIVTATSLMASQALRVLGVAYRKFDQRPATMTADVIERELVFVGLIGMIDPARPEVKPAIAKARGAGIRTIMITGDYKETARAIADEIGLLRKGGQVLTGAEIDGMDDAALLQEVDRTDVFARVSPQHKVRIVDTLRASGQVVAMTGDGVNDAPALRRADIGVAMGITGTDVTKETADMILTDDNYVSIVGAVEQGRIIYGNIRKFVFYLLACNVAEVAIILFAALAGWPLPLTAIQLLWLNLLTDGAPALALGLEQGDPDIMELPPRPVNEPIINRIMVIRVAVMAVAVTAVVLTAFLIGLSEQGKQLAQTMAFVTLALAELPIAFTARSERYPLHKLGIFGNKWMQRAVGLSVALTLAVVYVPYLNRPFDTVPLTLNHWMVILPLILVPAFVAEISKFFVRRGEHRRIGAIDLDA